METQIDMICWVCPQKWLESCWDKSRAGSPSVPGVRAQPVSERGRPARSHVGACGPPAEGDADPLGTGRALGCPGHSAPQWRGDPVPPVPVFPCKDGTLISEGRGTGLNTPALCAALGRRRGGGSVLAEGPVQWAGSRHVCLQPPFLPTLRPLLIVFMSSSGCLFTPPPLGCILLGRTTMCMWGPAGGVLVTLRVPGGATWGNHHWIREDRHGALPRRHIPQGSGPPGSEPRSKSRPLALFTLGTAQGSNLQEGTARRPWPGRLSSFALHV